MPTRRTTVVEPSATEVREDRMSGPERTTMPLRARRITTSWEAPLAAARDATLELQSDLMERFGDGSEMFEQGQTFSVSLKLYSAADDPRDASVNPYAMLNAAPFFVGNPKKNSVGMDILRRHSGAIAPVSEYPHRSVAQNIRFEHFVLVIPDFSAVEPAALCAHFRDRNQRSDAQDITFVLESDNLGPFPYDPSRGFFVSFQDIGSPLRQGGVQEDSSNPTPQFIGVRRVLVSEAYAHLRRSLPPFDPSKIGRIKRLLTDERMDVADQVMREYGLDLETLVREGILPHPYRRLIADFKRRVRRSAAILSTSDGPGQKIPDPWMPPSVVTLYIRTLKTS